MLRMPPLWCAVAAMQRAAAARTPAGSRLRSPSTLTCTPCRSISCHSCTARQQHKFPPGSSHRHLRCHIVFERPLASPHVGAL